MALLVTLGLEVAFLARLSVLVCLGTALASLAFLAGEAGLASFICATPL